MTRRPVAAKAPNVSSRVRRAKQKYECEGQIYGPCQRVIWPRDLYVSSVVFPTCDLVGSPDGPYRINYCMGCARYYRMLVEDPS